MKQWISEFIQAQKDALGSVPAGAVAGPIAKMGQALRAGRPIFVFGNGGRAANASHFVTDLGTGRRRRARHGQRHETAPTT